MESNIGRRRQQFPRHQRPWPQGPGPISRRRPQEIGHQHVQTKQLAKVDGLAFIKTLESASRYDTSVDEYLTQDSCVRCVHGQESCPFQQCQPLEELPLPAATIGGLRGEPFNAFPVENKRGVSSAIDYFTQVYGPVAVRVSGEPSTTTHTPFFRKYFQTLLHDDMSFEAIVALSQSMQQLHLEAGARATTDIIYHGGNSLTQLRRRLSATESGTSTVVILTILTFLAINVSLNAHMRS